MRAKVSSWTPWVVVVVVVVVVAVASRWPGSVGMRRWYCCARRGQQGLPRLLVGEGAVDKEEGGWILRLDGQMGKQFLGGWVCHVFVVCRHKWRKEMAREP